MFRAKGQIFNNMMRAMRTLVERPSIFIRDNPIFSSDGMLYKDYGRKGQLEEISFPESQWACSQGELTDVKSPVVK
jgi:hypothetical protein